MYNLQIKDQNYFINYVIYINIKDGNGGLYSDLDYYLSIK